MKADMTLAFSVTVLVAVYLAQLVSEHWNLCRREPQLIR